MIREYMRRRNTYLMMPGGSTPLSCLGYLNGAIELKEQIDAHELPELDYIFVAAGTGGTVAGLAAGVAATGLKSQVIGVRVTPWIVCNELTVIGLATKTLKLIRRYCEEARGLSLDSSRVKILHEYYGGAYGKPTEEGMRAVKLMEGFEGIKLETTYTGKALAALIDFIKKPDSGDKSFLFWNTFNSVDLTKITENYSYKKLPEEFHQFFE